MKNIILFAVPYAVNFDLLPIEFYGVMAVMSLMGGFFLRFLMREESMNIFRIVCFMGAVFLDLITLIVLVFLRGRPCVSDFVAIFVVCTALYSMALIAGGRIFSATHKKKATRGSLG